MPTWRILADKDRLGHNASVDSQICTLTTGVSGISKSRREFLQTAAAVGVGGAIWEEAAAASSQYGVTEDRTIRVAAVQMTIRCGDVDANLETARRLARKAIGRGANWIVLAGSNYFDSKVLDSFGQGVREKNAQILAEKPGHLASLVGAPVVLANPVGHFSVPSFRNPQKRLDFKYMGQSRIVDGEGGTLGVVAPGVGEDVLVADVAIGRVEPSKELRERLWIPDVVPDFYNEVYKNDVPNGAKIYLETVRKHRNGL